MTNFCLTNGVNFSSPHATEAIVPEILRTVWEEHQPYGKDATLWEIMQQGGVSGDSFIKIAYEEPYIDPGGFPHDGHIRILPLNSAFCFPEYHPHDYSRLIRMKLKYRFWGTALEGTRQVFSYTELWTEDAMQSFINDELVESQPNPLGTIPFIHIANRKVPSSPWGLSDIQDVTDLNREYNQTATYVEDIINYYASPTTVITGAKSADLQRGPKKVWAIPNIDAKITNLELNDELDGPLKFLELMLNNMHQIVGIPVGSLGQTQPISNTSGVALQMQMLPLMQKFRQKGVQYAAGFRRLNELILRAVAIYEPQMLMFDATRDAPLGDGQLDQLDMYDPLTYRNSVEFASPLPIDKLIALNEIQMEMALGLQSKTGALKRLGEAYPAEKLEELLNELNEDVLEQGALDLLKAQIAVVISMMTGVPLGESGAVSSDGSGAPQPDVSSAGGPGVTSTAGVNAGAPQFGNSSEIQGIFEQMSQLAAGTKIPQVRNPAKDPEDSNS